MKKDLNKYHSILHNAFVITSKNLKNTFSKTEISLNEFKNKLRRGFCWKLKEMTRLYFINIIIKNLSGALDIFGYTTYLVIFNEQLSIEYLIHRMP